MSLAFMDTEIGILSGILIVVSIIGLMNWAAAVRERKIRERANRVRRRIEERRRAALELLNRTGDEAYRKQREALGEYLDHVNDIFP